VVEWGKVALDIGLYAQFTPRSQDGDAVISD
jgi:hypothetical protein